MFKVIVARAAAVLGGATLATAALIGFTGTANAAPGLCPLDRPCGSLTYTSSNATVTARVNDGNDDADFYQVRWTINRGGAVQTYPQQKITVPGGSFAYVPFGPIAAADRSATIGFSVQGCTSGAFGSSCTGWDVSSIVPLPYGADTCANGFVWRDAFAGDHVCVSTKSRNQAATDNAAAASRVDPNGAWGPQTCVNGFVWRVARPSDLVCVNTNIRQQTANENANPLAHRV